MKCLDQKKFSNFGFTVPKPKKQIRITCRSLPLGHSSTVYITPKARVIDQSGKELAEAERNCRLDEDTDNLDIFNVYTKAACMFECKLKQSMKRCACVPWNSPRITSNQKVRSLLSFKTVLHFIHYLCTSILYIVGSNIL